MQSPATQFSFKDKALKGLGRLPPSSPTLQSLLVTLANDDIPFAQIAPLIEKDTVLAGNVLRTVNSPLYCFRGTINSVSHAISIMGLEKLRNTALGFSVSCDWKDTHLPPGWSIARFNMHSLATAVMADNIAQHVPVEYAEGAFVSGLFHDLGKLLIATALPDEYRQIARLTEKFPAHEVIRIESDLLGLSHAELSASALHLWNLPVPVQMASLYHHEPDLAPKEVCGGCKFHLGHIVHAANRAVNDLGLGIGSRDLGTGSAIRWLAELGLETHAERVLADFCREFEALQLTA